MAPSRLTSCPQCGAIMNRRWAACAVCGGAITPCEDEVPLQETTPATSATFATPREQNSESSKSSRVRVPATREEDTPAQYWSDALRGRFWVAPTDAHAATLAAQGQIAYQPDEVWRLWDLKARDPQTFAVKLRAIHQAKTIFEATVTHDAPPAIGSTAGRVARERPVKPRDPRLGPILPPCATCGDLRYWHDHDADSWHCWTCTPPRCSWKDGPAPQEILPLPQTELEVFER
jgi:hypothetical protein